MTRNLWLDDVRPAPDGYTHCRTAAEARAFMLAGPVEYASLDHDLGICERCTPGEVHEGANIVVMASLDAVCGKGCRCDCHETGYDFVKWCAETGDWPMRKPLVHSANPVGKARMLGVIERYWIEPRLPHPDSVVKAERREFVFGEGPCEPPQADWLTVHFCGNLSSAAEAADAFELPTNPTPSFLSNASPAVLTCIGARLGLRHRAGESAEAFSRRISDALNSGGAA